MQEVRSEGRPELRSEVCARGPSLRATAWPLACVLCIERLPAYVALGQLRLLLDGWPTSRRMSPGPQRCRCGCQAVGGDDTLHYLTCRLLGEARKGRSDPRDGVRKGNVGLPAREARRHRIGRPPRRREGAHVEAWGSMWFDTAGERDLIPLADAIRPA